MLSLVIAKFIKKTFLQIMGGLVEGNELGFYRVQFVREGNKCADLGKTCNFYVCVYIL